MKIDVNQFLKPCSCGRKHEIVVDDIIIDSGAINQLPEILKRPAYADKKSLVMICDENTYEAAGKQVEALVPRLKKIVLDPDNLHANEHGVEDTILLSTNSSQCRWICIYSSSNDMAWI